jgi:hypothetical protein
MNGKIVAMGLMGLLMTLNSCAQNTKNKENMGTEYRDKVKNIYKEVKTYEYNPIYQIRFEKFNCPMEFYVNDVLVLYLSDSGKTAGEQNIDVPQYILKSGMQSIRIKIYPLLDKNKKFEKFVSSNASLTLRVVYGDYEKEMKTWNAFKEVLRIKLPKIDTDLPFIELKGEFMAEVPYVLEGWSKGMNLSKEDPEKLEKEVLVRMKEIADLYRNRDLEGLAKEHYNRTKEIDQSMYFNTKENSAEWETELQESLNEATSTDLLDGKMKIMGNGKVVTVLINSGAFYNKAIIRNKVDGYSDFFPQYFYRPAPGARLEVIR